MMVDKDPVWTAIMAAPIDETTETEEETAANVEAQRTRFRTVPHASVAAKLGRLAGDDCS